MCFPFLTVINLKKLGTHAGNDSIVAFAKLHNVNVMIHQLNGKPLLVSLGQWWAVTSMLNTWTTVSLDEHLVHEVQMTPGPWQV